MSQTIRIQNGVAKFATPIIDDTISNLELAERLGIAEELIKLRELTEHQAQHLQAQTDLLNTRFNKLSINDGDFIILEEDIEHSQVQMFIDQVHSRGIKNATLIFGDISKLSDDAKSELVAEQLENRVADIRSQLANTLQENQQLHAYNAELQQAGDELGNKVDQLTEDNRSLAIKLTKVERSLADEKLARSELDKQLKALKKLDPERQKKQLAKLKKENAEKQAAIEALRQQNHRFVKDNKDKSATILKLDTALDKACAELNQKNTPEPLETINLGALGTWNIYGTADINRYDILDTRNNVSLQVQVIDGALVIPEVRTPPKNLQKMLLARAERYARTEQRIAQDQKPMAGGVA